MDINHIHPMLVHFPISLFLIAMVVQLYVVAIVKGDLADASCLSRAAFGALLIGTVAAVAAAIFGDIALENALELGFPEHELEEHEELGFATMWTFVGITAVHLLARLRGISLSGVRGWVMVAVAVIGIGVMVEAGEHGGELVYELGVNVEAVKP